MTVRRLALGVVVAALATACAAGTGGSAGPDSTGTGSLGPSGTLTVFGAASLTDVLSDIVPAYAAASPGAHLTISTGASSALETQIEQGAPADVFLSADTTYPMKLADAGLADGQPVAFATNTLVVVVPRDNPAGIESPADLARPGVTVIAAGDAVPITRYADQVVTNLAREPGYPPAFAAAYAANIVSREDNVAAVLAKIALGEGDAGIVYRTDAEASDGVTSIAIPTAADITTTCAGVVVRSSANRSAAQAFLAWLTGRDGQAVLAARGFLGASP